MVENKKNNYSLAGKSESMSSQVERSPAERIRDPKDNELLEHVLEQIEFQCFEDGEKGQAHEYAMIIAEIAAMPNKKGVRIEGENKEAGRVAEVYSHITHEHILHVMENLSRVTYEIKHMKTYLRTALYNSVFEMTSRTENRVQVAMSKAEDW